MQHVVIIGGGMVGLALSIAVRVALPTSTVRVLEARPLPTGTPDPLDTRASALNLTSRDILEHWQCWDDIAQDSGVIRHIHVSNQQRFGSALMDPDDVDDDVLGFVAENHTIGRAFKARAEAVGVDIRAPMTVDAIESCGTVTTVHCGDGETLSADLVVIADGIESPLRGRLGISVDRRETGQRAIVANVEFPGDQAGIAFERFTPDGPLALLPLQSTKAQTQRFNLVWSMASERAEHLLGTSDEAFLNALMRAFGWRLGRAQAVGKRSDWPLNRVRAREQSRPGIVIAGNAAHGIHPVAGQGLNLSLRDAATLATALAHAEREGLALGDPAVLRRYEQWVVDDQDRVVGATDMLSTLFRRRGLLLDLPRDAALAALDVLPGLRSLVAEQGTRAGQLSLGAVHRPDGDLA